MAAYQPPGAGHPGLAHAHPGMVPNPGQQMGQPMQMHPGVSGTPHVSQAGAMMGIQPGINGMGQGVIPAPHPGTAMGMPGQGMNAQTMAGGVPNPQVLAQQQQQMHQAQLAAQSKFLYERIAERRLETLPFAMILVMRISTAFFTGSCYFEHDEG